LPEGYILIFCQEYGTEIIFGVFFVAFADRCVTVGHKKIASPIYGEAMLFQYAVGMD
jgi:hypothetical protein